jgi:hypothetical protein
MIMKKDESKTDDDIVAEIDKFRQAADDYWGEIWAQYTNNIKFSRLGKQWDDTAERARKADGRPCLTFNKLPSFMRQVTNEARMNMPAITVKPAGDGADIETAKILQGLIKQIEVSSNASYAYDTAMDNTVAGGMGYIFITTDYVNDMTFEQDIIIKRCVNPLTVKFDPMSIEPDGSDAKGCIVEEKLRVSDFKAEYPDAKTDLDGTYLEGDDITVCHFWKVSMVDDTLLLLSDESAILKSELDADTELQDFYAVAGIEPTDRSRKIKRRKVTQYSSTGAEIIKTTEWKGEYIPVVPVYGEEVWDGETRYYKALHQDAQDAARMYNYFRTMSVESVALQIRTPYIGRLGSFDSDASKWATANSVNHAFIEYDGDMPPQRQGWTGVDQGSLQEAMNASEDMKSIMGIYDASLGNRSNETSGVAIAQRKSQAGVATYHFSDNLSRSMGQVGRVILDLIPHIYDTPRMVRILGDDGKTPEEIQLNQETVRNGRVAMFDVRAGKYDAVAETGPSFTTQREETAAQVGEIIRSYPQGAPILMDVLAENSNWKNADKVSKRFAAMLPPEIRDLEQENDQDPAMLMQQNQQMGQQLQQAEEAIEHLKGQLQQQTAQVDSNESQIQLELEREKNKGKFLDLQKQQQITSQKQAELVGSVDGLGGVYGYDVPVN